jgi:hypothetical protein
MVGTANPPRHGGSLWKLDYVVKDGLPSVEIRNQMWQPLFQEAGLRINLVAPADSWLIFSGNETRLHPLVDFPTREKCQT